MGAAETLLEDVRALVEAREELEPEELAARREALRERREALGLGRLDVEVAYCRGDAPLSEAHRELLRQAGLTDATIEALGFYSAAEGWGVPYATPRGVPWSIVRLDEPPSDGSRYRQPEGSGLRAYAGPEAARSGALMDVGVPLVFTEGVKKWALITQTARQAGLPLAVVSHQGVYLHDAEARAESGAWVVGADLEGVPLDGREVYILYDSDVAVNPWVGLAEARTAQVLAEAGATVRRCRIPSGGGSAPKLGADDFLAAEGAVPATLRLGNLLQGAVPGDVLAPLAAEGAAALVEALDRMDVVGSLYALSEAKRGALLMGLRGAKGPAEAAVREMRRRFAEAARARAAASARPSLTLGGEQVAAQAAKVRKWACEGDEAEHWYAGPEGVVALQRRSDQRLVMERMTPDLAGARVAEAFDVFEVGSKGEQVASRYLPSAAVKTVLAQPERFEGLEAVVDAPFFRPDGSVVYDSGYDSATATYLDRRLAMPEVSAAPDREEAQRARDLLAQLVSESEFIDDASHAAWWATLFLTVGRPVVGGPVPGLVLREESDRRGAGKTTLARLIGIIAHGGCTEIQLSSNDEVRKAFFAALRPDPAAPVLFDNVSRTISSDALARFMTADAYTERVLGVSRTVTLPNRTTCLFTMNEGAVDEDLATRCLFSTLRAREGWGYSRDVERWARAHRGELRWAVMTLIARWLWLGRPVGTAGGELRFPAAKDFAAGVLRVAGVRGFLDGRAEEVMEQRISAEVPSAFAELVGRSRPAPSLHVDGRPAWLVVDLLEAWEVAARDAPAGIAPPKYRNAQTYCREVLVPALESLGWTRGQRVRAGGRRAVCFYAPE